MFNFDLTDNKILKSKLKKFINCLKNKKSL